MGAHVINSLIDAGHSVVGTLRRESLIDEIYSLHPEWKDKLELITVKDLADEATWDSVFTKYSFDHVGTSCHHNSAPTGYRADKSRLRSCTSLRPWLTSRKPIMTVIF